MSTAKIDKEETHEFQTETSTLSVLNVSVASKCCSSRFPESQNPRYFTPEQHKVRRLHPQRTVRLVVLSYDTTMFQGIFEVMTQELTALSPLR